MGQKNNFAHFFHKTRLINHELWNLEKKSSHWRINYTILSPEVLFPPTHEDTLKPGGVAKAHRLFTTRQRRKIRVVNESVKGRKKRSFLLEAVKRRGAAAHFTSVLLVVAIGRWMDEALCFTASHAPPPPPPSFFCFNCRCQGFANRSRHHVVLCLFTGEEFLWSSFGTVIKRKFRYTGNEKSRKTKYVAFMTFFFLIPSYFQDLKKNLDKCRAKYLAKLIFKVFKRSLRKEMSLYLTGEKNFNWLFWDWLAVPKQQYIFSMA